MAMLIGVSTVCFLKASQSLIQGKGTPPPPPPPPPLSLSSHFDKFLIFFDFDLDVQIGKVVRCWQQLKCSVIHVQEHINI